MENNNTNFGEKNSSDETKKRPTQQEFLAIQAQIRADNKMYRFIKGKVYQNGNFCVLY